MNNWYGKVCLSEAIENNSQKKISNLNAWKTKSIWEYVEVLIIIYFYLYLFGIFL